MLDVRMFFSALVDADFLETEAHFNGDAHTPRRPRPDGPLLDVDQAIAAMEEYLTRVRERHRTAPMAATRESLLRCCVGAATRPMGIYSLAAPTGSGKTLAMLAFALQHAKHHGLRRIVLVMPFLNIIEQTARVYRDVFSPSRGFAPDTVLEHHSLAVYDDGTAEHGPEEDGHAGARLLAENWDAPIVLTTTVQFFESLMASRPARCRKLHRLAQSVILFDEVQTLPLQLAVATLATLSRLADPAGPYRSTVVFATATQPAFDALQDRVREFASSGWQPQEIVADCRSLFAEAAGRGRISWRHEVGVEVDDLASELQQHERVLCIVNLKRHAVQLAEALRDRDATGLLHLSTNMCPAHRTAVLEAVNKRLGQGKPVRLVATQCVEAGVDLDFPVVYRALAPLEAIAQAAGRCNRHGIGSAGRVIVFKPCDDHSPYPPGYRQAVSATELFLASLSQHNDLDATEILNDPELLQAYFRQFYTLSGRTSGELDDEQQLLEAIRAGDFAEVSDLYKLIPQDAIQVVVPYDRAIFDQLCEEISADGWLRPEQRRDWLRRATPHAVGLFRPQANAGIWNLLEPVRFTRHPIDDRHSGWYISLRGTEYDPLIGIAPVTESLWIA
jgi:CRISPR-associated helicase Cas3